MPGSTFKKCSSCNVHISVACKICKHCGQKQEMKKAIKAAKQKITDRWVENMKCGNNFCKLVNSANVLMHKFHALGRYPLLLLGKRNVSGCFTTDLITNHSFSSPQEKVSIDTIKNIFSSVLKVKYSALDTGVESNHSMTSSGEDDCGVNTGVDAIIFPEGDGPRDSTGGEDFVTLILTPVDLPSQPSCTFQPPIKKRILEKSKGVSASPPKATTPIPPTNVPFPNLKMPAQGTTACDPVTYTHSPEGPEDSSVAVEASAAATNVLHLPVPKSIQEGPEDSSAAVEASAAATNVLHLPVPKSIQEGPEDSSAAVEASAAATNVLHLPVPKLNKICYKIKEGPEDSSAAVEASAAATNVLHLPVPKLNKICYKIKDCPVHLNQEHFPVLKTMGTRIAKNGEKEVKVRWQPCSGCGAKWKDSWEPYDLFHAD